MKENVLDVLMYLFENYMDDDTAGRPDRESLQMDLLDAGFPHGEINKALQWLEDLANRQAAPEMPLHTQQSMRLFSDGENQRMDMEARGFILFLEQVNILTPTSRELVIDRVMALETDEVNLDQLKWVILLVLFNQPGQEAAYAWMEDLVFDSVAGRLQ